MHYGKVLSVSDQRKTSGDGDDTGPGTGKADGIEDAEILGEGETRETSGSEAVRDSIPEVAIEEPRHDTEPAENMAPEAAPEIGPAGEPADVRVEADARPDPASPWERVPEQESAAADDRSEPPPERPAVMPPPRRPGAGGLVLAILFGAALAALAGVAAARFIFPDGWPGQGDTAAEIAALRADAEARSAEIAGLEATIADLAATARALDDRIAALPDPEAAAESLRGQLSPQIDSAAATASDLAARLDALEQGLSEVDARLSELAQRPVPEALDIASLDAELAEFNADLSAAVEEARAEMLRAQEDAAAIAAQAEAEAAAREQAAAEEADALRAEAEAAAAAAAREAAISRIRAAIENGEPYADDLAALGTAVPEALAAAAEAGVPSLVALSEAYPPAARQALDASIRATMGDGALDRVAAFLRVQTGARSLEPRPGDDPDAVLSRAEAALRAADIETALTELAALPEAGQAAMADWIDAARTRHEAAAAARALTPN